MSYVNEIKKHLESLHLMQGDVLASLRSLDALLEAHREQMHPQLVHYLSQRSYDKARIWLGQQADRAAVGSGDTETVVENASGASADTAADVEDASSADGGSDRTDGIADAVRKALSPPPGGCSGRMHRDG